MFNKVFLDANILLDFVDNTRATHSYSSAAIISCLDNDISLYTSCDIVTTIYYLGAKKNKVETLKQILQINTFCKIIEFANIEVKLACELMSQGGGFTDLEDTIQYVLAAKEKCELIISNDKRFFSPDIELVGSLEFCDRYGALK